jgi:hypothetical protein
LFASQTIHLVVLVTERPHTGIDVQLLSGNMKRFLAQWEITPTQEDGVEGIRLTYSGEIEPEFFVPPVIGDALVEKDVKEMLNAVAMEIAHGTANRYAS